MPAGLGQRRRRKGDRGLYQATELWLAADQGLGKTSRRRYLSNLMLHVFPYVGSLPIKRLTVATLSRMTKLQRTDGFGESTAWYSWKTLRTILLLSNGSVIRMTIRWGLKLIRIVFASTHIAGNLPGKHTRSYLREVPYTQ